MGEVTKKEKRTSKAICPGGGNRECGEINKPCENSFRAKTGGEKKKGGRGRDLAPA